MTILNIPQFDRAFQIETDIEKCCSTMTLS